MKEFFLFFVHDKKKVVKKVGSAIDRQATCNKVLKTATGTKSIVIKIKSERVYLLFFSY